MVNTQFYNSGGMPGCDGKNDNQGTEDFITSQVCTSTGPAAPSRCGRPVTASGTPSCGAATR
ncbi:hypothetical protein P3T35_006008 [Kitasatospora sp. GP30]|uniref:hypothetical protein n=1 Tax=Kitasatospora sp. GP30 TaxID=3035084 RepID=UPI0015D6330B|nr:hypothetical protein [Kitasatospora sp. GP30]